MKNFFNVVGKTVYCFIFLITTVNASSPEKVSVGFGYASNTTFGRSLYVVGSHEDLGSWDPAQAVRLYYTAGSVWTGQVAVQAGTALEYKFISRDNSNTQHCDSSNADWMSGDNLSTTVEAQPEAPYSGKTIYYHSGWTNAFILYSTNSVDFVAAEMDRVGDGRTVGEYLYSVSGIGEEGEGLEFIPYGYLSDTQYYDHAPYGGYGSSNYYTTLDVFFLQDGNVYNYWPPATVSASRIETTNIISSWDPTIPSRDIRIYLPRGYDENTWKSYPVLYMHDGQNVFAPGGIYGCWGAESSADREISQGRMRETIIVGVDNSSERSREYIAPGDDVAGPGTGDLYANFLIHNVRPTVDFHYRTLNDLENTLTLGSSFGGIISAYLGLETNVFGKVGPMSPSFWAVTNFVSRIDSNDTKGIRIYMDSGTGESSSGIWEPSWNVYDLLLRDGYAVNDDLLYVVGCGHSHNEAAWSNRLPEAYHFLLNAWDEPNYLAQEEHPQSITNAALAVSTGTISFSFTSLKGFSYRLERTTSLVESASWELVTTSSVESLPWSTLQLSDTNLMNSGLYRVTID